ncbi:SAM-dependent methyltransferase [Catenuloplanes nepalensis]|uniref:SAM-dependent methyltransferase n=1 Tax=Catenuloplanes nepalensis TaxID=587533 RepID=A0ABT9MU32_9ACTN|nr:class I SAM-dependent methyltransferase [Catenuloplanes nepalensis]MDP9794948.1 SAM-dependent methyltransferase [Catenuloplanes nepalensis]
MQNNIMRLLSGLTTPLLAPLDGLPPGAHVVQLACGTGSLSIALAGRRPDLRITAIDINPAVLAAARSDAARARVSVDFREMSMAALDLADGSADAVVSRMGLFLPGTAPFGAAAREAARVLRPGGVLSAAAWTGADDSPYTRFGPAVLRRIRVATPDFDPPFAEAGRAGALEGHLVDAGLRDVESRWFHWETDYPDFESWWSFNAGFGPLGALFGALTAEQTGAARQAMAEALSPYRTSAGGYRLPATARHLTARAGETSQDID